MSNISISSSTCLQLLVCLELMHYMSASWKACFSPVFLDSQNFPGSQLKPIPPQSLWCGTSGLPGQKRFFCLTTALFFPLNQKPKAISHLQHHSPECCFGRHPALFANCQHKARHHSTEKQHHCISLQENLHVGRTAPCLSAYLYRHLCINLSLQSSGQRREIRRLNLHPQLGWSVIPINAYPSFAPERH